MEPDSNGTCGGCSISFNENTGPNNVVRFCPQGRSVVVPLGPLNSGRTGNIIKTIKVDGKNKLDIMSYSGDYSALSQLNQDMLGRRHSVDSNIGRTRQPTFVRTYRDVRWKRVNKPTKFPPVSSPLTVGQLGAVDCNENVGESREYITGTNIIRQRVPIFKTNGEPPSMAGRRFSAGDLIPVTGFDLNLAPNGKCLVIRDILPNNLMSNSNSDDSSSSRKGSTSSSEDITSSPHDESRRASDNTDSLYEFCLIDEDDEDAEVTDDGTDEDDEESPGDKTLFKNAAIEYVPSIGVNSTTVLYSFSAPALMSSPLTMANGSTGHHDLRRLVLKNSMQMKTVKAPPNLTHSTGTLVSDSPVVCQTHEVMKSAMIQQSLVPFAMPKMLSVTMESAAQSAPTEANGIPLTIKPTSVCILDHCVQVQSLNETVTSPSVTPTVLMSGKKTLQAQSHEHSSHTDASEVKLHSASVPSGCVAGETSWVLTSTKIADANVYVSCFHPPNSKVRVRRAHWVSPQFVKGTIPIDMEGAKAICVELVAVPTTSSDELLMFQRVTYSSGYIYRSAHWAAPTKGQITHTACFCKNNTHVSGRLHTTSIPHVSVGEKIINNYSADKIDEMQKGVSFLDHPLRIHPLLVNSDKTVGVQAEHLVGCRNDYISPIPVAGHSFCKEPNWKCANRNLYNGVNFQGQCSCTNSGVLSPSVPLILTSTTLQRPLMSTNVLDSRLSTLMLDGKPLHLTSNKNLSTSISDDGRHPGRMAHLSTVSRDSDCNPAPPLTAGLQILSRGTLSRGNSCGIYTNSGALHTEQTKLTMAAADSCQSSSLAGCDHVATKLSETVESFVSSNSSEDYNCLHSDPTDTQPSFNVANKTPHVSTGKNSLLSCDCTIVLRPRQVSSHRQCASDLLLSEDNPTKLTGMNTGIKTQARFCIDSNGLIQTILSSISDNEKKAGLLSFKCGGSTVAIDNKIEQAMDLVKRHLMYAVREEVEILKQQIGEMMERIGQLEYENTILRSEAKPETLNKLQQPRASQTSQSVLPGQNASVMSMPNLQQPQQSSSMPAAQSQPPQQAVQPLSQQQVPQTPLFQAGQSPL